MPKPSAYCLLTKHSVFLTQRSSLSALARGLHSTPRFQRSTTAYTTTSFRLAVYEKIASIPQKRNMSSPADHKPLKQAPKTPPSARYASPCHLNNNNKLIIAVSFSYPQQTKFSFSIASKKPPASPPHMSSPAALSARPTTAPFPTPTTQAGTKMAPRTAWPRSAKPLKNAASS
jgi:hypothetical protein